MANNLHKGDRVHLTVKPDSRSAYTHTWSPRSIYEVEQSFGDENGEVTLFEIDKAGNVIRDTPLTALKKHVVAVNTITNSKFKVGDIVKDRTFGGRFYVVGLDYVNGKLHGYFLSPKPNGERTTEKMESDIVAINTNVVNNATDSDALKIIMDSVKGYLDRRIKNDDAWRYPNYVITILRKVCDTATMSAGRYDNQRPKHRIYDIDCTFRGRKFRGNLICTGLLHRDDPDDTSTFDEYDMTLSLMNVGKAPGTTNSVVANALAWKRGVVKNAVTDILGSPLVKKMYASGAKLATPTGNGGVKFSVVVTAGTNDDESADTQERIGKEKALKAIKEVIRKAGLSERLFDIDAHWNGRYDEYAGTALIDLGEAYRTAGFPKALIPNASVCNARKGAAVFHGGKWWVCPADEYGEVNFTRMTGPFTSSDEAKTSGKSAYGIEVGEVLREVPKSWISKRVPHYLKKTVANGCNVATNFRFAVTTKSGRSITIEAPNYKAAEKEAERRFGKGSIVNLVGNAVSTNRVMNAAIHEEDEVMYDGGRYWVEEVSHDGKSVIISDAHGDTTVEVPVSRVKLVKQNSVCNAKFKVGDKVVVHWGDWRGDDPGTILERGSYGWVVAFDDLTPYKEVNERIITIRNSSTNPVVNAAITWKDKRDAVKDAERYAEIALKAAWSAYERGNSSRVQEILKDLESRGGISAEKAIRTIKQKFI